MPPLPPVTAGAKASLSTRRGEDSDQVASVLRVQYAGACSCSLAEEALQDDTHRCISTVWRSSSANAATVMVAFLFDAAGIDVDGTVGEASCFATDHQDVRAPSCVFQWRIL